MTVREIQSYLEEMYDPHPTSSSFDWGLKASLKLLDRLLVTDSYLAAMASAFFE
jgi:hypothetical protein